MSGRLRVGVVGAGFGGTVHVPAYRAVDRFEVVAIASPARAETVAKQRAIPRAFPSLEAMLDGCELDVVSIASPPYLHREQASLALARGKHVMLEKPFALDVAQAEALVAAAASAGTVCALAHEFRYTPERQAIAEMIRNGHLGAMRALELSWLDTSLRAAGTRPRSWWFERARGGGVTGAILSHLVDQATWLAGRPPVRSSGYERTANPHRTDATGAFESDVADGAYATIDYGDGLVATVTADATRATPSVLVAAHGEARTIVASGANLVALTTFVVDEDATDELDLVPQAHAHLAAAHPNIPAFATMLAAFARRIDGDASAELPTFADGLATQRVLASVGYGG